MKKHFPKNLPFQPPPLNPPTHPTVLPDIPPAVLQPRIKLPFPAAVMRSTNSSRSERKVTGWQGRSSGLTAGSGKIWYTLPTAPPLKIGQIKRPQKENSSSKHLFSGVILLVTRRVLMYTLMKTNIWNLRFGALDMKKEVHLKLKPPVSMKLFQGKRQ